MNFSANNVNDSRKADMEGPLLLYSPFWDVILFKGTIFQWISYLGCYCRQCKRQYADNALLPYSLVVLLNHIIYNNHHNNMGLLAVN